MFHMCTVSWLHKSEGYTLLCNRDECLTRKPASGPLIIEGRRVQYIAPVDGDHGGSWIGVNNSGLTLCLLNRYGEWKTNPHRKYTSRGLLITSLLKCEAQESVRQRITQVDLERFQPFTMIGLAVGKKAMLFDWTGSELLLEDNAESQMPLTSSSSTRNPDVIKLRKQQFESLIVRSRQLDANTLYDFHRSHEPARGPYSVCMHRDDAATVSLSAVCVSEESVEFTYHPASPCLNAPGQTVALPRIVTRSQNL
jgi:uncharacterized protein with NRDE domain